MAREFAQRFYHSREWARARQTALIRDKGMCQMPGCHRPAREVHHKVELTPENINDSSITLNPDNLISLCRDCHFRVHEEAVKAALARTNAKKKTRVGENSSRVKFIDGIPVEIAPRDE